LYIAIEPADKYETDLISTCLEGLSLIHDLGQENLGVLLDTGHALVVGEDVVSSIHHLGARLFHVHVDDNLGQRDQHLVPGDGIFDFVGMLRALNDIGYDGGLGAELGWGYTIDPDPPAKLTVERMRQFEQDYLNSTN